MNLKRILGLRGRQIEINNEDNNRSSVKNLPPKKLDSESEEDSDTDLPSLPGSDSDLSSISSENFLNLKMAFDPKEAREDIPDLLGKSNFQQFMAICQDFKDELGENEEVILVKIIKRKLKNIEAFTLCRNATTFDEIKNILSNKFGEKAPLNVLISDMVNLRQRENEDAKSYGDRALILQEKLELVSEDLLKMSTLTSKDATPVKYIYSRVIIEYFINGLKIGDVKNIVKSNNFTDLEKAAVYAHSLESSFKTEGILNSRRYGHTNKNHQAPRYSNHNVANKNHNVSNNSNQNNVSGFSGNRNYNGNNYVPQNSNQNHSNNAAGFSGNWNNNGNNHRYNRNNNHNQPQIKKEIKTEPINYIQKGPIKCDFCGRVGHLEQNCRFRHQSQINVLEQKNEESPMKNVPNIEEIDLMKSLGIS